MNRKEKIDLLKQLTTGGITADQIRLFGWTRLPSWVYHGYSREELVEQYGELKEVNGNVYAQIEAGDVPQWFNYSQ